MLGKLLASPFLTFGSATPYCFSTVSTKLPIHTFSSKGCWINETEMNSSMASVVYGKACPCNQVSKLESWPYDINVHGQQKLNLTSLHHSELYFYLVFRIGYFGWYENEIALLAAWFTCLGFRDWLCFKSSVFKLGAKPDRLVLFWASKYLLIFQIVPQVVHHLLEINASRL